ncbi:hypothetical protein D9758_009489 [Tetrapyrgos nigripes]|uniref:Cytochrome P450 n=1 Tax=Tetrapyrgos nigripes TaxID=182062 RepID=A0A8H5LEI8_9AGAR|nr:hypothetical protein D9758_009489 [Tetrapyrgos nigripes]
MVYVDFSPLKCGLISLVLFLIVKFIRAYSEKSRLRLIPTVGPDGILTSYITVFKWISNANEVVNEGYRLYPGGLFKIPTLNGWEVVISGRELLNDLRGASDQVLNPDIFTEDALQAYYTMHPNVMKSSYHTDVIRTTLTRNIGVCLQDTYDEVKVAMSEKVPLSDDWIDIPAFQTALEIVVRISNRFFVGLPLCRDPEFCDLNINFTSDVFYNALTINQFPKFLHPIVGRIFTSRRASLRKAVRLLKPMIEERLKLREKYEDDWPDKPNDFIQWCIDAQQYAPLSLRTSLEDLCVRVLFINFAAVHATSAFTFALYNLACHPELVDSLRQEAEAAIEAEGWTKPALLKMRLLDSFLMESARTTGPRANGLLRKAMQDFTFSNGMTVPRGTYLSVATGPMLRDNTIFPDPEEFKPFRFAEKREKEGVSYKHQLVTPTSEWVLFGQGKHACPGRFFAGTTLKLLMAHVLLHYDVQFPNGSRELPQNFKRNADSAPDRSTKVMFRRRSRN